MRRIKKTTIVLTTVLLMTLSTMVVYAEEYAFAKYFSNGASTWSTVSTAKKDWGYKYALVQITSGKWGESSTEFDICSTVSHTSLLQSTLKIRNTDYNPYLALYTTDVGVTYYQDVELRARPLGWTGTYTLHGKWSPNTTLIS